MKRLIEIILILAIITAGAYVIYVTIKTPLGGNSVDLENTGDGSEVIINQKN